MSKNWLDLHSLQSGIHSRIPNTSAGWSAYLSDLPTGTVMCMEATGAYYHGFAVACVDAGLDVRVVNPWQVKSFADAGLSRSKTDKVDARLIAEFCQVMLPKLWSWRPLPDTLAAVTGLVRLGDGVLRHRVAAHNRAHAIGPVNEALLVSANNLKDRLREERDVLISSARSVAEGCPVVGPWYSGLQTLPGIGPVAALKVLAYSGDMRRFGSARQYAAFTGLPPRLSQSGDSKRSSMSRRGSRELRGVFYWAAMSASQSKSDFGRLYEGLLERGKRPKVALVAVGNRLARAAWRIVIRKSLDQ